MAGDAPLVLSRCARCGLPAGRAAGPGRPAYCCLGCMLAASLGIPWSEEGEARSGMLRLALGSLLAMNVMAFSMILYAEDLYPADPDAAWFYSACRWLAMGFSLPCVALLGQPVLDFVVRTGNPARTATEILVLMGVAASLVRSWQAVLASQGPIYLDTACMTLLFLTLGRLLEARARALAAARLAGLATTLPIHAIRTGGATIPLSDLVVGDRIEIAAGATVPVDGKRGIL